MADIIFTMRVPLPVELPQHPEAAAAEPGANADPLVRLVELMFFAYRDFTGEADVMLAEYGFGRAHHRVLHFVNRYPGLRVADLLDILKITKQSLARVLRQLIAEGFIVQRAGEADRRERLLHATPKGRELAERLLALQVARVGAALDGRTDQGRLSVETFLSEMIAAADRPAVMTRIRGSE